MLEPNPWMVIPFGLFLGLIALAPLLFGGWWSRHYSKVSFALGAIVLAYYFLGLHAPGRILSALAANLVGTTGASMLLIRPWLRMNKYRVTGHHVVFFIFIVSNVGGCLTPIGDPPLYLGYLQGIPFWWVAEHCWPIWAVGLGVLLVMFYGVDQGNYLRAPRRIRDKLAEPHDVWRF